jgi:hypothetical protein
MTQHNDIERLLDHWFSEGPGQAPDRVVGIVTDRIERQSQRPAWRLHWRPFPVNAYAKFAVAAAAVLIVAVVGYNLLPGRSTGVGGPGPSASLSPTPAATPTASPTPSATPKSDPVEGDLQPGTYTTHPQLVPGLAVTFTVPGGWTAYGDAGAILGLVPTGEPGNGAPGGIAIQFRDVTTLKGDPCHWSGTDNDIRVGPTANDLVQALQEQTAFEASEPVDVMVGGYAGQRVDIVSPTEPYGRDVNDPGAAVGCDDGVLRPWDGEIYAQGPANRWQTNVLDVDGTRLVIVVQDFPGTTAADRAELDAIVDSMVIKP